jgi:hypothetical protein
LLVSRNLCGASTRGGFEPLLTYASAINNFARGDLEEAGNQIVNLPEQRSLLRIAGVILPIPAQILIDTDEAQEQNGNKR